jgi:circadian clock protein KaiC
VSGSVALIVSILDGACRDDRKSLDHAVECVWSSRTLEIFVVAEHESVEVGGIGALRSVRGGCKRPPMRYSVVEGGLPAPNESRAMAATAPHKRVSTGIDGLDDILGGGLPANRIYAVLGGSGVGKTTLALQFLLQGRLLGEAGLHVTLSESAFELEGVAASHGWSLAGVTIYEPPAAARTKSTTQTMFSPAEVELDEVTDPMLAELDRVAPTRVVIDSMSQIRLLAGDPLRYRREMLALKRHFAARGCTVLFLDEMPSGTGESLLLQTIVHGVIALEKVPMPYGVPRSRLAVRKLRGSPFREGAHDYRLRTGGLEVYPRLIAAEHPEAPRTKPLRSEIPQLDALFGGGLDSGTSTLFIGPAGAGKSTLATLYAQRAAARGDDVAMILFAERVDLLLHRSAALGMDIRDHVRTGRISVDQLDPSEVSPGELSDRVRRAVEERQLGLVVLDSLNGYFQSTPDESFLSLHLHELLGYLNAKGVATIVVLAQRGLVGTLAQIPVDVSYLADAVVLLRFFEARGRVRSAVSMLKKRSGAHEHVLRELYITAEDGIQVGPSLEQFQGVLTGVPEYVGSAAPLLDKEEGDEHTDE